MLSTNTVRRTLCLAKSSKATPGRAIEVASNGDFCACPRLRAGAAVAVGGALRRLTDTATDCVAEQTVREKCSGLFSNSVGSNSNRPTPIWASGIVGVHVSQAVHVIDQPRTEAGRAMTVGRAFQMYRAASVATNRSISSDTRVGYAGSDTRDGSPEVGQSETTPQSRKEAFARSRAAGVTRRLLEGGGVPRDSNEDAGDHDRDSDFTEAIWEEQEQQGNASSFEAGSGHAALVSVTEATNAHSWLGTTEPAAAGESGSAGPEAQGAAGAKGDQAAPKRGPKKEAPQPHPVLGYLIADLKYKRVYRTSVEAITRAPVWEKPRTLRPVHAMEIAEAKYLKRNVVEGMPGVITLYKRPLLPLTKDNQKYALGIVDGQHRLGALLLLADKERWDRSELNIIVEVFTTNTEEEIGHLFAEINRAEPMKVVDMPHGGPEEIQASVDKAVVHLYKQFPDMFGGKRCRSPSLHPATFKENIVKSGMIERHQLFSPQLLLDYLLRVNQMLGQRDPKRWAIMVGKGEGQYATKKSLATALRRAKRFKFWLGLDLSWMNV